MWSNPSTARVLHGVYPGGIWICWHCAPPRSGTSIFKTCRIRGKKRGASTQPTNCRACRQPLSTCTTSVTTTNRPSGRREPEESSGTAWAEGSSQPPPRGFTISNTPFSSAGSEPAGSGPGARATMSVTSSRRPARNPVSNWTEALRAAITTCMTARWAPSTRCFQMALI